MHTYRNGYAARRAPLMLVTFLHSFIHSFVHFIHLFIHSLAEVSMRMCVCMYGCLTQPAETCVVGFCLGSGALVFYIFCRVDGWMDGWMGWVRSLGVLGRRGCNDAGDWD